MQDNRVSDVIRWKEAEKELFELEKLILAVDFNRDAGELDQIDFSETEEVLSEKEQRERWTWELQTGLIDRADILMQQDPDKFQDRDAAEDYLFERSGADLAEEDEAEEPQENTLLAQLTRPVE